MSKEYTIVQDRCQNYVHFEVHLPLLTFNFQHVLILISTQYNPVKVDVKYQTANDQDRLVITSCHL